MAGPCERARRPSLPLPVIPQRILLAVGFESEREKGEEGDLRPAMPLFPDPGGLTCELAG